MSSDQNRPDIRCISAVSLATQDMQRAVRFYRALGLVVKSGGERAAFTSLAAGTDYLNLIAQPDHQQRSWWGRVILYVSDVDGLYQRALDHGLQPQTQPSDAPWGERYFHITDPDGHELSFAKPLSGGSCPTSTDP